MIKRKTSSNLKVRRELDREEFHALTLRLLTVQDEERRKLSRDLYDDFCQRLSALGFEVTLLEAEPLPDAIRRQLQGFQTRLALGNASKHSGAKHVRVVLKGTKEGVVLSIRDDGKGFDPQSAKRKGGLGLISMKERVRLVNGQISIQSESGHGSKIIVTAPCPGTAS